jgi:acyl carrier protein
MSERLNVSGGKGDSTAIPGTTGDSAAMDRESVVNILADHLVLRPSELTDDKQFARDLGFDDLDYIDIALAIEDTFLIQFTGDDVASADTVGALVAVVVVRAKFARGTARSNLAAR